MEQPAVDVADLHAGYGEVPVLAGVALRLAAGAGLCVTGENGAGKSTLLRCVAGLHRPSAGTVRVFGEPPGTTPGFWRAVATTAEPPTWYPGLTVGEHAELVCRAHGLDPDEAGPGAALERFGLAGHADAAPGSLSSGQRQRLALALALLRPSTLLVLDEPEQRLDPAARDRVAGLLRDYLTGGGAVLMAAHDAGFAAAAGARVAPLEELAGSAPAAAP